MFSSKKRRRIVLSGIEGNRPIGRHTARQFHYVRLLSMTLVVNTVQHQATVGSGQPFSRMTQDPVMTRSGTSQVLNRYSIPSSTSMPCRMDSIAFRSICRTSSLLTGRGKIAASWAICQSLRPRARAMRTACKRS